MVNNSFLIQIYKAQEELNAMCAIAGNSGIHLVHDGNRRSDVINLYNMKSTLIELTKCLTLGVSFITDGGYADQRNKGYIVIEKLCYVIASLDNMAKRFNRLGLVIKTDAFDGHYQKMLTACIKAFDLLCDVSTDMEETHAILNNIDINEYTRTASQLFHTYSAVIKANLDSIAELW